MDEAVVAVELAGVAPPSPDREDRDAAPLNEAMGGARPDVVMQRASMTAGRP